MARRASVVKRISSSLNTSINTMLGLYEANLFIDRSVRRIMFGPQDDGGGEAISFNSDSNESFSSSTQPLPTISGDNISWISGTNSVDYDYNNSNINESIKMNKETGRKRRNIRNINDRRFIRSKFELIRSKDIISRVIDEATLAILKEYDKVSQYLDRLGVDIDPYKLLAAQLYPTSKVATTAQASSSSFESPKSDSLNAESSNQNYEFNSMMAFFQNNSLQKYDLYTGIGTNLNGQIIRWNNLK